MAIYHIRDVFENTYGPEFVLLASRLPLYDSAVRRRMELELQKEESGSSGASGHSHQGEQMSMKEALARSKGDDIAVLQAISDKDGASAFGPLFEYSKG